MDPSHKKALLLLKAIIFLYHDFTEDEKGLLESAAVQLDAKQELIWAMDFINEDIYTAYERTREKSHKRYHICTRFGLLLIKKDLLQKWRHSQ